MYGFIQDVANLMDLHATTRVAFCFDFGYGLRKEAYPAYKADRTVRRQQATPEERAALNQLDDWVDRLRSEILTSMGYANVFAQEGYESDDIIASLVFHSLRPEDTGIIISSDQDLYQLLRPNVLMWSPGKRQAYTHQSFFEEWRLPPEDWPKVKAIAGCGTDNVRGVPGVGEVTAAKYLRGELKADSAKVAAIRANWAACRANLPLVKLPYPGTGRFTLRADAVTQEKWAATCDALGFRSLRTRCPVSGRQRRAGFGVGRGEGR